MSTPTTPSSGTPAPDGDPANRPTAVVGQVPGSASTPPASGYGPPASGQPTYGPSAYGPSMYGGPAYGVAGDGPPGPPPMGMVPGGYGLPPAPRRRGWIGWLIGGVALLLVAGAVGAVLLFSGGGTLIGVSGNTVAIPDADPAGVTDTITLDGSGRVQDVHLEAAVTHPYTCDLTVRLISPQGTTVTVADPPDCSRDRPNLAINLDSATPGSPLAPIVGQESGGPWRLQVVDSVGIDQGTLTGWGLTVQAD